MEEAERFVDKVRFCEEHADSANGGGAKPGGSLLGGVPSAGHASPTATQLPKRSVRIAESAKSSTAEEKQASLRINEARDKAKIKVKFDVHDFHIQLITFIYTFV